jgi:O-succinylbenzoate synthase
VAGVLARFPGCRTAKVKVAASDQTLAEDVARVRAVRQASAEGRPVDANGPGTWTAEHAMHASPASISVRQQPCATIEELAEIGNAPGTWGFDRCG